jgi:hypothetical protein
MATKTFVATVRADGKFIVAAVASIAGALLQYGPVLTAVVPANDQHYIGIALNIAGLAAAVLSNFGVQVRSAGSFVPPSLPTPPSPPTYSPPK